MSLSAITLGIKFVAYNSIHFIKGVNDVLLGRKQGFIIIQYENYLKLLLNLMLLRNKELFFDYYGGV